MKAVKERDDFREIIGRKMTLTDNLDVFIFGGMRASRFLPSFAMSALGCLLFSATGARAADLVVTPNRVYGDGQISKIDPVLPAATEAEVWTVPFTALPVMMQRSRRSQPATVKVPVEAARVQDQKEAELALVHEKEMQDQLEAEARFDLEQKRVADSQEIEANAHSANAVRQAFSTFSTLFLYATLSVVGILLYFFPSHVGRRKRSAGAIFVLNLLTGWTVLGWVIALIWACTKESNADLEIARTRRILLSESPEMRL